MYYHYLNCIVGGMKYSSSNNHFISSYVDRWRFNVMSKVHEGKAMGMKATEYYKLQWL